MLEELDVEDSSSGSDYMADSGESGGSSGGSESLEVEFDFVEDVEDLKVGCDMVGRSKR